MTIVLDNSTLGFCLFTEKNQFTVKKPSTIFTLDPKLKLSVSFTMDVRRCFYN